MQKTLNLRSDSYTAFLFLKNYLLCVYEYFPCMYVCAQCENRDWGGQKQGLGSTESQSVVNHHADSGDQT